jgi:SAM-dependent methyltransferase
LDVGCGFAMTGKELKQLGLAKYVVGIEANPEAAESAKKNIDEVICCNAEDAELPFDNFFDYIILSHILEHLYDPSAVLKKIMKTLKNNGKLIVGLPNIKYWRILRDLIFKDMWEYQEAGILDYDHVRFFTMRSAAHLFEDSNYEIKKRWFCVGGKKQEAFNLLTGRIFQSFLGSEIYIIAGKRNMIDQ